LVIHIIHCCSDNMRKKLALHEEEQLFIDVIRNINTEASTLARDERAEVEAEALAPVSASESESTSSNISSITAVSDASVRAGNGRGHLDPGRAQRATALRL